MASPVRTSGSRSIHSAPRTVAQGRPGSAAAAPRTAAQGRPRPAAATPNLAAQGRPRPATIRPPTTPRPFNPHLADYSQTNTLRTQIGQQAQNNPSLYATLVGKVNGALQLGGYGISPASHRSIMENLQAVNQGTMTQSAAHFEESQSFAQDALASFSKGRLIQGHMEGVGATINLFAGVGMLAVEEAQRRFGE